MPKETLIDEGRELQVELEWVDRTAHYTDHLFYCSWCVGGTCKDTKRRAKLKEVIWDACEEVLKKSGFTRIERDRGKLQRFIAEGRRRSNECKTGDFSISISLKVIAPNPLTATDYQYAPKVDFTTVNVLTGKCCEDSFGRRFLATGGSTEQAAVLRFCSDFKRILEQTLKDDLINNNDI